MLRNKGRENPWLLAWLREHEGHYRAIPLNFSYANASYQTHRQPNADTDTEEVLIVNY